MTLTRVPVKDFRGGLNTRDSPFELSANESPDLLNVTISSLVGQLEQRKGKTRYDVSGLPETETVDNAKQVVLGNSNRALMLSINGSIWYCDTTGAVKKLFAGTAGTIWTFEVFSDAAFKDWVYCANGVDAMQKWDGVTAETVAWPLTFGAGFPTHGSILKVWEDRMFISGPRQENNQRIYFSEFGDPEATIKEYGFVDVRSSEEDLDAVQDLAVLGSRLIVLKQRSIYFISSAVTMANRRIGGPGVWGMFQTVELEDKLYFFNPQGIWSTGGVQVTMESGSINSWFPKHLTKSALSKARLIATRDTYPRLLLAVATDAFTTPNTLIEMVPHINFRRIGGRRYLLLPAFFLHSLPATALANWNPTGEEELVVGCGSANSTAGKTSFPNISITDDFFRPEENPLSNGGAWVPFIFPQFGFILQVAIRGFLLVNTTLDPLTYPSLGANRYAASGEITNPVVEIELFTKPSNTHAVLELFCCLKAEEAFRNGYSINFIFPSPAEEAEGKKSQVSIEKRVGGIPTTLKTVDVPNNSANGTRFGMTVLEGKIKAWWNIAGKGWELLTEVEDATFTKGYSAIGFFQEEEGGTGFRKGRLENFRTAAIPSVTQRLSTLFTGTTDEGDEIAAHWHSAWMVLQGEEPKERVRRVNVELQGDAVLDMFTDFSELPKFSQIIPKGEAEGSEYRFERVRPETWGRFHSVKLRSLSGGQPFLVNAMEVVYRGGKQP